MKEAWKISVIVPVYNAETYLRECLDSIVAQTYRNLEILLINDGSTDGSPEICREYAQKDDRVLFITQENAGAAVARCTGFRCCSGEFVMFVDADDLLCPGICKEAIASIRDCDMLIFEHKMGIHFQLEDRSAALKTEPQYLDCHYREALLASLIGPERQIHWDINLNAVWGKLYRREFLEQQWFERAAGVMIGEDMLLNLQILLNRPNVCVFPEVGYCYRENLTSVVHRYLPNIQESNKRFQDALQMILMDAQKWDAMYSGVEYQRVFGWLQIFSRDIFHPDNPKADREKRNAFTELVDDEAFRTQVDRNQKYFGAVTRCKLILAKNRLYTPLKFLFLLWSRIKTFVGR